MKGDYTTAMKLLLTGNSNRLKLYFRDHNHFLLHMQIGELYEQAKNCVSRLYKKEIRCHEYRRLYKLGICQLF